MADRRFKARHAALNPDQQRSHDGSPEESALERLRDAINARDNDALQTLTRGELPSSWPPAYADYLGTLQAGANAWLEVGDRSTRPDANCFGGLALSAERLAAQHAAAASGPQPWHQKLGPIQYGDLPPVHAPQSNNDERPFSHGKIEVALRFVLASIAERDRATASPQIEDDTTAVLPAATMAADEAPTVRIPRPQQSEDGAIDPMDDTRVTTLGSLVADVTGIIRLSHLDPDTTAFVRLPDPYPTTRS